MKKSMSIALCGLTGALMTVTMLLGSVLPLSTMLFPAIAGLFLLPILRECGFSAALTLYFVVAALSLLLLPDKEAALLFTLLLGLYPLCRPSMNRIPHRTLRMVLKLLLCNLLLVAVYALLLFVIAPAALLEEFHAYSLLSIILLLALANVAFFVYDLCLTRVSFLYEYKLRAQLFGRQKK